MTQPTNTNTYGISVGTATSVCPIFEPFDPTIYSIGNGTYKTQQRWVNTVTNAIWVLESFSSSNGVVTANWKALAPIVVETVAPTSANYQYPLGQPWLNTTANAYYILVALSGTTATWDELTSSTSSGILTINTVGPTVAGNFTIGSSASTLTITNATNGINIDVTQPLSPAYGGTGVNNGTDTITLGGNVSTGGSFTMSGAHTFTGTLTGNTSVTFPTSGTLATTSQLPTFPISLANGGTSASLTASNGGIFYSNATTGAILSGTATANQVLLSGSSSAPAWSTATYPATTSINQILYSSSANTIGGITTADNGVLITGTTGIPSILSNSGTAGYVLTANSGAPPSWQPAPGGGEGSAVAWAYWVGNGSGGNQTLSNSYNVTSVNVNVGTGATVITFTNALPDNNYVIFGTGNITGGNSAFPPLNGLTGVSQTTTTYTCTTSSATPPYEPYQSGYGFGIVVYD